MNGQTGPTLRKIPTIVLALIVPIIAVATVLITLNATSDTTSSASSGGGQAGPAGSGTSVSIKNFQYSPDPIVVKAGSSLTVTNDDGTAHTLTADDKSFDTDNLDGGAKGTIKIGTPGTYTYHCDIHNYMTGTIEAK